MSTPDKMVTPSASVSTTTSRLTSQIHQFAIKNSGQKMFKHVLTTFKKGTCGVISNTSSFSLLCAKFTQRYILEADLLSLIECHEWINGFHIVSFFNFTIIETKIS